MRFFVKRISHDYYSLCIKGKYRLHTIITDLSLSNFGGDPDDDYLIGIMGERNTNKIIKFLKYILAEIIPYFEN